MFAERAGLELKRACSKRRRRPLPGAVFDADDLLISRGEGGARGLAGALLRKLQGVCERQQVGDAQITDLESITYTTGVEGPRVLGVGGGVTAALHCADYIRA